MKDILRKLTAAWGPSGRESEVAREIESLIRPHVDEVRVDPLGNVIARLGPGQGGGVMLSAHMDQANLVVTDAMKDGLLRFAVIGKLEAASLPGSRVRSRTGAPGVVALEDGLETKDIAAGKMVIDIGAADRDAARKVAGTGEVFLPESELVDLGGDRVSSPALDDRAGCAALIAVAQALKAKGRLPHVVSFVFSVQGAVAPRGARAAAFGLEPDLGLAVDVTPARGAGKAGTQLELGQGAAIRVKEGGYVVPPQVRAWLQKAAEAAGVPHQDDVSSSEADASDAQAIEIAGSGVLTGMVGLPGRWARTTACTVSLADLDAAVKLLVKAVERPLEL